MENKKAFIITGPTSGLGYETTLELAKLGTVVLVGRNPQKLEEVEREIKSKGQNAVSVVSDVSDITSVRKAAQEITNLNLDIAGLLNNAGIMPQKASKSKQNWDMTFATNYLGAFALTEAMIPHLSKGANIVFIGSAIEDPERKPAKIMGMKGGRFISVEANANGNWKEGGSKLAGIDAYATSKLCVLAAAIELSRENPTLNINVAEPGIMRGTSLGAESTNRVVHFIFGHLMSIIPPFSKYSSTPQKSAKVIANILANTTNKTGIYFDEKGNPMQGSEMSRDLNFQRQVVNETRTLLGKIS